MTEYPPQHTAGTTVPNGATGGDDTGTDLGSDAGVKDKAAASAQAGKQAAADVAQSAAGNAKDVAQEASKQARQVLGEAQNQLQEHARDQHRNAVSNLRSLSDELRSMADGSEQQGPAADLVAQAGTRVDSVASWLDGREPGDLVEEVRRFARRRPGAFLIGALAAGVLAGRLTRGVVAVHQDDDGSPATSTDPTASHTPPTATPAPVTDPGALPNDTAWTAPVSTATPTARSEVYP